MCTVNVSDGVVLHLRPKYLIYSVGEYESCSPNAGDTQSDEGLKGRSLASRLLSKKGDKRGEELSFGGHAQSSQRRGSSLPTFDLDETSTAAYAARQQSLPPPPPPPFAPQAAIAEQFVEQSGQSTDDLEALQKCGASLDTAT